MSRPHRYSLSPFLVWLALSFLSIGSVLGEQPQQTPAAQLRGPAPLESTVDEALGTVQRRYLTAGVHSPWQIMHGVLALGSDMQLREGADGDLHGAIDFICRRAMLGGRRIVQPTAHGLQFIESFQGQGHPDQFLAIFAQVGVPENAPIEIGQTSYTVADLVKNAEAETGGHRETSWTIIALSHYRGAQSEWRNQYDQRYTLEGLLRWELDQSVEDGACGGTHRLMALTRAVADYRRQSGQPLQGVWQQAFEKGRRYLDKAQSFQQPDGSFSSEFFIEPRSTSDFEDHLHAHGHTLEWVAQAVETEELQDAWVTRAVEHLCGTLIANRSRPIDCGSLYHAGSALRIYRQRRWGKPAPELAETTPTLSAPPAQDQPTSQ